MSKTQKMLTVVLWAITVVFMIGAIALWPKGPKSNGEEIPWPRTPATSPTIVLPSDLAVLYSAPSFLLTDQDGKKFGDADLRGHPYIVDFMFTHCPDTCPQMTSAMSRMQSQLSPGVKLVSFTVDPDRDTVEAFHAYAKLANADTTRWHFLTGTKTEMYDVALGMEVMSTNATIDPLTHNTHFFLVDGQGKVRSICPYSDADQMAQLVKNANALDADSAKAR